MYVAMCVKELNDKKEGNIMDSMNYEVIFLSFSRFITKRPIKGNVFCALAKQMK